MRSTIFTAAYDVLGIGDSVEQKTKSLFPRSFHSRGGKPLIRRRIICYVLIGLCNNIKPWVGNDDQRGLLF